MNHPYPDPEDLLPHGSGMCLVEEILEMDENELRCRARVSSRGPLGSSSGSPCVVGIEIAAQASALHRRLAAQPTEAEDQGYLVRVRNTDLHAAWLPVDDHLQVTVRRKAAAPPLFLYDISVSYGEIEYVSGTIGIYGRGEAGASG